MLLNFKFLETKFASKNFQDNIKMAKKQKSFADKASGKGADADTVMVKYVNSVKSEKTGFWRFNEKMVKLRGDENLDAALKRMDESENLVDIDLSSFESASSSDEKTNNTEDIKAEDKNLDDSDHKVMVDSVSEEE